MSNTKDQLRVTLECNTVATANSLVFAFSSCDMRLQGETVELLRISGGVHSRGRFVYLLLDDTPRAAFNKVMTFVRSRQHEVALIGLTSQAEPWDPYDMVTLQCGDTEIPSVQVWHNVQQSLLSQFFASADVTAIDFDELLKIIRLCRLHEDSVSGDEMLCVAIKGWEKFPSVEAKKTQAMWDASQYASYLCRPDTDSEGTKLLWRVLAHILTKYNLNSI